MRISFLLLTVGVLSTSGHAMADDHDGGEEMAEEANAEEAVEASSDGGYGSAGCGLGSLLFDPDSGGFGQILAATTNGSSGNQTFGITSGTSNCDLTPSGYTSARRFVETNRVAMSNDISRGRGETIDGLTELAGCNSSTAVGMKLQKSFKTIFPSAEASNTSVSAKVVETLKADKSLACKSL